MMKAMILAAGLGTRLKPFTDEHPKALAVINGKTLLQRNIEYLLSYRIKDIIVNIHHFPEQIRQHVEVNKGFGASITFSDESDGVLETGGGLARAEWFLKDSDPFVLMNVDVLTDLNLDAMTAAHRKQCAVATLAVSSRNTSRYFLFDGRGMLCGWENVKTGEQKISREILAPVRKAFSGIHVISPEIFEMINRKGKFSIVDVYLDIAKNEAVSGYDHSGSKFVDVGKPESLLQAEAMFQ